ncbi:Lnb N-terminal periplasmic domain-containing protein [Vibrio sp. AND4]|uniref:Lnb N-terminal periplasmic domain-containing protein n=1 Tax=Vibrio sp. AND4 TaxID=314289 RepID=UPI0002E4B9D7
MNKLINSILITASCVLSSAAFSDEEGKGQKYDLDALSSSSTWRLLIHYEEGLVKPSSAVTSPSFLLAPNGKTNPEEELKATIQAFTQEPTTQCRFPARKIWLESVMPKGLFPEANCPKYQQYLESFATDSVSVVYASGYLGNPASMYGHVLLKFNSGAGAELLDNTFSYGAMVPDSDNKLVYIYKGITGGYQGHFANQKYHHQNLAYNETELRDLWEYKLSLTEENVVFLLAHLWELENTSMTYYFFKQNCGYQLAKLLELVVDKPLLAPNKIWVMPYDLVMMLNKPETESHVDQVLYHESRQEKLYNRFNQLSASERQSVERIIALPVDETLSLLRSLKEEEAKRVIDTMYDYYAFLEVKNSGLSAIEETKRENLLTERFRLSAGQTSWEPANKLPPHRAQNTAMLQFSSRYNDAFGSGASLRFRANYYDLLNINAARIPFSELSTFDLSLLYTTQERGWSIRELTLFNVLNLNVSQTGLAEDNFYAWSLNAGYKPNNLSCIDCSDMYVGGFLGKSMNLADDSAGYAALAGEILFSDLSHGAAYIGPEIGAVLSIAPYWATSIKVGSGFNITEIAKHKNYLKWEQRFFENRNFDIRTLVQYDEAFEYAINFSTYW